METKVIKLRKLRMIYFKGFKDFEVDFNDRTVISGRNKAKKTSVFDAFSWLLFGKDSLGNTDFDIKTLDENENVIEKVDHEVYGELEINGSITKLRRILRENWVKPRGQEYEYLKGNETKCFFDSVPLSVTEYQKRVNDIVDENLFKLITNTNYFHSLKKEDRRNILVSLAGEITNESIAADHPEFEEILSLLNNSTSEDVKRRIGAEKKRIKESLDDIPVRIDELKKGMPEAADYKVIEKQIEERKTELSEIDKSLSDRQEAVKDQIEKANSKRKEVGELRLKQQDILIEAELEATRVASEKNKDFYNYKSVLTEKNEKSTRAERRVIEKKNDISDVNFKLSELQRQREKFVEQWKEESAKKFTQIDGCLICPLYNHECTDGEALFQFSKGATDAEQEFNTRKTKRLNEINEEGTKVKGKIELLNETLSTYESELIALKSEHESIFNDYQAFAKMTPVEQKAEPVVKENIPEWVEIETQIKAIQIEEVVQDNSDLNEKRDLINSEIVNLSIELNKKDQIEKTFRRIEKKKKEQRTLSQALAEQEGIEFKLLKFNKLKMEEVDRRVNGMFKYVKFKLFDKTLEGNEFETCETLIGGVRYYSANNEGRINGGLDVINALCDYNKVYAPIFADNSESVNEYIPTKSQLIELVVTEGDLKIE